ncbi:aldehyde dehydrogenase family protein [Rubrimonas cliftonensis]|uniref:Betaine-aldehyde dehydrogenase n=1 Tax=Rubrimonas cliftonensis TaxID=89524 RepID=A0A1H4GFU8_9RHOB|nr:aldehyde dehydrogenase family protein [Rubrimonas cliftonensis]SEB08469.1 betaine-aldehyde dehydrogenase [Rubrimonas cliftonensis]
MGKSVVRKPFNWISGFQDFSGTSKDAFDPASHEVIGHNPDNGSEAVKSAVAATVEACHETMWAHDRELRARVLEQQVQAFGRNRDDFLEVPPLETGKIREEAALERDMIPSKLRNSGATALADSDRAVTSKPVGISLILGQAMGVAPVMAPRNSPAALAIRSLAAASAAGCTTVMNEAEDMPKGVINLFFQASPEGSAYLVASPEVPVVNFAGSKCTGRAISSNGAKHLKRFGMELGGKTPRIVLDDSKIYVPLPALEDALTFFDGQCGMTGSQLLMQNGGHGAVCNGLAEWPRTIGVGPAGHPSSDMGPLIDRANIERVDHAVQTAIAAEAKVVERGDPVKVGFHRNGAFFRPASLEVCDDILAIMQEETFGTVITIQWFSDEAEAIRPANDHELGLAASIRPRDLDGSRLSRRRSKQVWSGSTIGRGSATITKKAASSSPASAPE